MTPLTWAGLLKWQRVGVARVIEVGRHSARRMICQSPQPGDCRAGPIDSPGRRRAIRQHGPAQSGKTTEQAELAGNGPTYVSPDMQDPTLDKRMFRR